MTITRRSTLGALVASALALGSSGLATAADYGALLKHNEGVKSVAENGVRAMQQKSSPDVERAKAAYEAAAAAQNAWLDAAVAAITQGTSPEPVAQAAEAAATAVVAWVSARTVALGEPAVPASALALSQKGTARSLTELCAEQVKRTRNDEKKRAAAAQELNTKLRWKPWSEIH